MTQKNLRPLSFRRSLAILLLYSLLLASCNLPSFLGKGGSGSSSTKEPSHSDMSTPSDRPDGRPGEDEEEGKALSETEELIGELIDLWGKENDTPTEKTEKNKEVLGKLLRGLDGLSKKAIEKGWIDTTSTDGRTVKEDDGGTLDNEKPAPLPDKWYYKDFTLTYVKHAYWNVSMPFPENDETHKVTYYGGKLYIQLLRQGMVLKCYIYEPLPDGYRETIYSDGKVSWTHDFDNEPLTSMLSDKLRHDYTFAKDLPSEVDLGKARESTRCARPCLTIDIEEKEDGADAVTTVCIDKQYRFMYSLTQVGKNKYGGAVNITPFEITSFSDRPTERDVPDPKSSENPIKALKRQLQEKGNL